MVPCKRVLVVDDDPDWMEAITDFLTEEGYAVDGAENGAVALEMLERGAPVVAVVTDVQMPVMDGNELLARLRAQRPALPVIVVTSEHVTGDEPPFLGALRVLRKPVAVEELLSAVAAASSRTVATATPRASRWGTFRALCAALTTPAHAVVLTIAIASSFALANLWLSRTR
ncbi:MAG TPA: response regulator [Polyangia bacterium]|jgi:two-component system chemotaxis response regulator CheY|nr:response regulator [Polyangia bacterium]